MPPRFVSSLRDLAARPWARRAGLAAPAVALFALFVATDLRGVDFGKHWDEMQWHIQEVRDMIGSGVFLPHWYIYPSLSKWLAMLPALPAGLQAAAKSGLDPKAIQAAMKAAVAPSEFLLAARRVFIVVCGLSVLWIYAAALALRRRWWEAFIAAATLGLSWEFAYHARWVANDCLLTQFAALTVLMLALFHRTGRPGWVYGAAVAVGLGTGAKYPGVILLVPVLIAGLAVLPRRAIGSQLSRAVLLCALAFAAYLVTTPGTLLAPFTFIADYHRITKAYAQGHYGYTVSGPAQHWKLVLEYFAFAYFSPWKVPSLILALAALWGAVSWVRLDRRFSALLVGFPLAFLIFFCGRYIVMIVRNYLLIGPFVGLLVARGIADVADRLPRSWLRAPFLAAFGVLALAQAVFLIRAAESIARPDVNADARAAVDYIATHPKKTFRVSPKVRAMAAAQAKPLPPNVKDAGPADDVVFFPIAEGPNGRRWTTNDPWLTEAVFGPREMNFNWYSTWEGRDRIVVMTVQKARAAGVQLAN